MSGEKKEERERRGVMSCYGRDWVYLEIAECKYMGRFHIHISEHLRICGDLFFMYILMPHIYLDLKGMTSDSSYLLNAPVKKNSEKEYAYSSLQIFS